MALRQVLIARKDLGMSPGKLAAQVAHASWAFMSRRIAAEGKQRPLCTVCKSWRRPKQPSAMRRVPMMYKRAELNRWAAEAFERGEDEFYVRQRDDGELELCEYEYDYVSSLAIPRDVMEEWFRGIFTKTVCEAKNRNDLLKAVKVAEGLGLRENEDFFLIRDACLTELAPEETDENGVGRTLTCIGFRPLPDDLAHRISRKYQLYK